MELIKELKLKAIALIEEDKPGPAIDILQAICTLNLLEK